MTSFVPPHGPRPGFNRQKTPEVKNNPFGDNFTQRIPKGLNNLLMKKVELEWELLTWAQAMAMESFMDQRQGTIAFTYALPPEAFERRWICSTYGASPAKGDLASFSATFEEVP